MSYKRISGYKKPKGKKKKDTTIKRKITAEDSYFIRINNQIERTEKQKRLRKKYEAEIGQGDRCPICAKIIADTGDYYEGMIDGPNIHEKCLAKLDRLATQKAKQEGQYNDYSKKDQTMTIRENTFETSWPALEAYVIDKLTWQQIEGGMYYRGGYPHY